MIPPTSIDGTDITGATIDGTDVSEITVDGDTVFQAVTLPEDAIHQWKWDEGSGTSFSDSIGTADGTFSFDNWPTDTYTGGAAVAPDGSNDTGSTDANLSWLNTLVTDSWAFAYTIDDFTASGRNDFVASEDSSGLNFLVVANSLFADGDVFAGLRGGIRDWQFKTSSGGHVNDGNKHRVLINKIGPCSDDDLEIYIDNTAVSVTQSVDENPTSISLSQPLKFFGAEFSNFWGPGTVDNCVIYDDDLTTSEVQQDFDAQPWS